MKRIVSTMLLAAAIAGCGEDKQYDNVSANGVLEAPSAPVEPTPAPQAPQHPWGNRDRNAPFQTVKFGETVVRVPTGYIALLSDKHPHKWKNKGFADVPAHLLLETLLPGFPTHAQLKDWKNPGGYNAVYVRFAEGTSEGRFRLLDEEAVLHPGLVYSIILGADNVNALNVEMLNDLGLKRYSNSARPHGDVVYIPVGDAFRAPNGELMPIVCPPSPRSSIDSCQVGYRLTDRLSVNYSFPLQHLARWKEVRQFVLDTVQIVK